LVLANEPNVVLINSVDTELRGSLVVVGIPAFNEEKTIASVVLGAQKHADIVVVCDDGSKDLTVKLLSALEQWLFVMKKILVMALRCRVCLSELMS
jgi:cellulose synthase/poly-beta-1,6-N-acetylglucosamine synthase-like glycosyltransferase